MKINVNNTQSLERLLYDVNGQALQHTAKTYDVQATAAEAEDSLAMMRVPKAHRQGARVTVHSGQKVPSSYKYRVIRTAYTLERGRKDWFVISCYRMHDFPGTKPHYDLIVTRNQRNLALAAMLRHYSARVWEAS